MRTLTLLSALTLIASCATAQTPPALINPVGDAAPADKPLRPDSPLDDILDAMHQRGQPQNLKDFVADVSLMDTATDTQESTIRRGKVWYQAGEAGNSRIRVVFPTKETNGKIREDKVEYVLSEGKLIDRNYPRKVEVTRRVLRPGQKMNLLKLGEGPFPLPIGQAREDVYKMFDVKKLEAKKDDPAGTVPVGLSPKPDTDFARKFATIDVWVDLKDHFPRRIETTDKNNTVVRTTDLTNVQVNTGLTDKDFTMEKIDRADWILQDEEYSQ